MINNRIHSFEVDSNISIEFHDNVAGSKINKLAKVRYSLPYWESNSYITKLRGHLKSHDRNSRILDAGCGDGRFTMLLLEMGFTKIYALDTNLNSLLELDRQLSEEGATDRVVLVHASVSDLPFQNEYFDAVLSIGVLYYLNEGYEDALKEVARVMRQDALLLETEPDLEGCAVKALVFDGLESFINVTKNHRFLEYFEGKPLGLRCFSEDEMYELHEISKIPVNKKQAISLFPSLLTIGRKKNTICDIDKLDAYQDMVKQVFATLDKSSSIAKHKLWVCKKA